MRTFNLWTDPRDIRWLEGIGHAGWPDDAVDRLDQPLSALVESVRHACDVGASPRLQVTRRRLSAIEARVAAALEGLDSAFDRLAEDRGEPVPLTLRHRTRAALELVQGKARATREWLLAMADRPAAANDAVAFPAEHRAGGGRSRQRA